MLYAIAKGMDQNVVALHTANGLLDTDADWTPDGIGSLWCIAPWRLGGLFALARLLGRDLHPLPLGVRWPTTRAAIDPNIDSYAPVQLRGKRLLQHAVIMMMSAQRPPQTAKKRVRERHAGVLQRLPVCFRCQARAVWWHRLDDDRHGRWPQGGGALRRATPRATPPVWRTRERAAVR